MQDTSFDSIAGVADGIHCPYRHISEAQLVAHNAAITADPAAAAAHIAKILCLPRYRHDAKAAASVNFTVSVLQFAQQTRMTSLQSGVLFNISQTLLAAITRGMDASCAKQGQCCKLTDPVAYTQQPTHWACAPCHARA
jgi:hypothetical protein